MSDIIFHHYPSSPFSEKIRLILGFKKLPWKSVVIPAIMPKPDLTALTGGYRRTPVMQIGADIYCDTALIADVLERIAPTPSLYPAHLAGAARMLAQWADTTLFWTVVPYALQPAGMQNRFGNMPPEQIKAFIADRAALRANAPRMSLAEAAGAVAEYLKWLDNMLAGDKSCLLSNQPTIADFSVYHSLWFLATTPAVAGILDDVPRVQAWMKRIAAIGHCQFEKMSADEALLVARESKPGVAGDSPFFVTHGVALGDRVAVMPTDYGIDPVEGELVLSTVSEFALRRTDPKAGTVVVHFPRLGFQLKKV